MSYTTSQLIELLGDEAEYYLGHQSQTIPQSQLHLPGGDIIDRVWRDSDRPITVLRNLQSLLNHGRLAGTGYTSIFPVDQGIEHAAGASFAKNTSYFDPAAIVEFAVGAGLFTASPEDIYAQYVESKSKAAEDALSQGEK